MNGAALDDGIGTGEIDMLKYAEPVRLFPAMVADGAHAVFVENENFTGIDLADERSSHGVQRTGFRSNHVNAVLPFAVAERMEAVRIPERDELLRRHHDDGIRSDQARHGFVDAFLDGIGV